MVRRLFVLALFLGIIVIWYLFASTKTPPFMRVVVDGDPVVVISWQEKEDPIALTIPAALSVDAVGGYGKYPIRSLWQLGEIESVGGEVLAQSLEELLGLSIPWYVGEVPQNVGQNPVSRLQGVFSPLSLGNFLTGRYKTNISPSALLSFMWNTTMKNGTKTRIVEIDTAQATTEVQADGSVLGVIKPEAIDTVVSDEFENRAVRQEKLTISVENATTWPGLALSVARKIGRMGGNVVRIGNSEELIDTCLVEGTKPSLNTKTAENIVGLFSCEKVFVAEEGFADLTVVIGREYEVRFRPLHALPRQSE